MFAAALKPLRFAVMISVMTTAVACSSSDRSQTTSPKDSATITHPISSSESADQPITNRSGGN